MTIDAPSMSNMSNRRAICSEIWAVKDGDKRLEAMI